MNSEDVVAAYRPPEIFLFFFVFVEELGERGGRFVCLVCWTPAAVSRPADA